MDDIRTYPAYVINLDRRPDRWRDFRAQPTFSQFKELQRFSAVDGSKLNPHTDSRISLHTRLNILRNYRRSHFEINTLGAIGASLSHIGIWKAFLQTSAPYCVVFEDDTLIRDEDLALIDRLSHSLPAEWDMWLLGTHKWMFEGVPLSSEKKGWQKVRQFTGAHAYVLSRRGAEILLQEPFPIETHIEFYITACALVKDLKIVRHPSLRMTYSLEATKSTENDSDTFDDQLSCPVCYMPDDWMHSVFAIRKNGPVARGLQITAAVGLVWFLWSLGKKRT